MEMKPTLSLYFDNIVHSKARALPLLFSPDISSLIALQYNCPLPLLSLIFRKILRNAVSVHSAFAMKTPKNLAEATVEEKRQFIASFDTVLLDCDGNKH